MRAGASKTRFPVLFVTNVINKFSRVASALLNLSLGGKEGKEEEEREEERGGERESRYGRAARRVTWSVQWSPENPVESKLRAAESRPIARGRPRDFRDCAWLAY